MRWGGVVCFISLLSLHFFYALNTESLITRRMEVTFATMSARGYLWNGARGLGWLCNATKYVGYLCDVADDVVLATRALKSFLEGDLIGVLTPFDVFDLKAVECALVESIYVGTTGDAEFHHALYSSKTVFDGNGAGLIAPVQYATESEVLHDGVLGGFLCGLSHSACVPPLSPAP